jgi:hypothetical protein
MNVMTFRIALFALLFPIVAHADTESDEQLELARQTVSQWTWGIPTNGVVGGIYVSSNLPDHKTEYRVYVHEQFNVSGDSLPPTFHSEPNSNAFPQGWFLKKFGDKSLAGRYFEATNNFCGPVTLCDSNGIQAPLRRPELVSAAAYPSSFRPSELGMLDALHNRMATPLFGRLPALAGFKLEDLFEIKKPGDYVLTVWPKIYRRLKNDDDLCERIDVPPISLKIHWSPSRAD